MEQGYDQEFLLKGDNISEIQHTKFADQQVNLTQLNEMQINIIQDQNLSQIYKQHQYTKGLDKENTKKRSTRQNASSATDHQNKINKISFNNNVKNKFDLLKQNNQALSNFPKTSSHSKFKVQPSSQLPVSIQVQQARNFLKKIQSDSNINKNGISNIKSEKKYYKNRLFQRGQNKMEKQANQIKKSSQSQKLFSVNRQINSSEDRLIMRNKIYEMNATNYQRTILSKKTQQNKVISQTVRKGLINFGLKQSINRTESVMEELKKNIVTLMNKGESFGSANFQNQFSRILQKISF